MEAGGWSFTPDLTRVPYVASSFYILLGQISLPKGFWQVPECSNLRILTHLMHPTLHTSGFAWKTVVFLEVRSQHLIIFPPEPFV